jgi:hypothetical protein
LDSGKIVPVACMSVVRFFPSFFQWFCILLIVASYWIQLNYLKTTSQKKTTWKLMLFVYFSFFGFAYSTVLFDMLNILSIDE